MSNDFVISEFVERLPFLDDPGEDSHGNRVEEWGAPEAIGIYAFDPGDTTEPRTPGRDRVITTPTIYGPATMPFGPHDMVRAHGRTYLVDGDCQAWRDPSDGEYFGAVVRLRKVTG